MPAVVVRVFNQQCVNVTVLPDYPGGALSRTSVMLRDARDEWGIACWCWPPRD